MNRYSEIISEYLLRYKEGEIAEAWHGLVESGLDSTEGVSAIASAFDNESCLEAKSWLLSLLGQFRCDLAMDFLKHNLRRSEDVIWKIALDGLAEAAPHDLIERLEHVLFVTKEKTKAEWIEEVIRNARN